MMARRTHTYPQVEPGAVALVDARVAALPRGASVARAVRLARTRDAVALVGADDAVVMRDDLDRAAALGLEALAAETLSRPVPVVAARASEVAVRRALARGAPIVVVRERPGRVGAVRRAADTIPPGRPLARVLDARLPKAVKGLLDVAARSSAELDVRVYLVGGLVRDLLLDRVAGACDVDLVVDGDAPRLARSLAAALGGRAVVHDRFLTAAVTVPGVGIVDVATARAERYDVRGALPRVTPAGIARNLERRDFTVNAMAVDLGSGTRDLIDPLGGHDDLARRRIRVLHPLSFVEDPTRIFRAARYAARFGFTLDAWTARGQALALSLVPYPALSGARICGELERTADAESGAAALRRLGLGGAYRLVDPRFRFTRATSARLGELRAALASARAHRLDVAVVELTVACLLADQRPDVVRAALERLGFVGEPRARVERSVDVLRDVAATLGRATTPSARARTLRHRSEVELAAFWLAGGAEARRTVEWFVDDARAPRPALRGEDVVALGVRRGPDVKRVLDELRDARLDGTIVDREAETEYVRHWLTMRKES